MSKGDRIRELLVEGKKYHAICNEVKVALSTVAYHAKIIGLQKHSFNRVTHDWVEIQKYYDDGHTVREITEKFGADHSTVHAARKRGEFIPELNRAVRQAALKRTQKENPRYKTTSLIENSEITQASLRKIIKNNDLIPYYCSNKACGLHKKEPIWAGRSIVLHLDHINGIRNDNRLVNLRYLCPNCHSQTSTYCGRNKRLTKNQPYL